MRRDGAPRSERRMGLYANAAGGKKRGYRGFAFYPRDFTDISDELKIAEPYRKEFLALVKSYAREELASRKIDRSDVGYVRTYGDFILRIAFHETVHAGQLLNYLRTMNAPRPNIWD